MCAKYSYTKSKPLESKFEIFSDEMNENLQTWYRNGNGPLYMYQIEAVLKTQLMIANDELQRCNQLLRKEPEPENKPVLIVAPTGSGKSGMIVLLPYVLKSKKVLVLTPSKVITEQLCKAYGAIGDEKCFFEDIGLVPENDEHFLENRLEEVKVLQGPLDLKNRFGNLYVTNAQKFSGRSKLTLNYNNKTVVGDVEEFFKKFDTLIVDEAHHYPAPTWYTIVELFGKPVEGMSRKVIFLTATPKRNINGRHEYILDSLRYDTKERIAIEITQASLIGVTIRKCEFVEPTHDGQPKNVYRDMEKLFQKNFEIEPRVTPKAMILVRTKVDADDLAKDLNDLSGNDEYAISIKADKKDSLRDFTEGKYKVGITCGVGLEGYDNANVTVCVILKKIVKDRIRFSQFVGRCMRMHRRLEPSDQRDQTIGYVLSYPEFKQRKLWDERQKEEVAIAEEDPAEDDNE